MSVLDKLKALDKQREQLLSGAKNEALQKANDAIADLNALGFNYSLAQGTGGGGRKGTRTVKDTPCPVCNFKTEPLHDARKHRSQGNNKRPFNSSELGEFGLTKV